MEEQIRPLVQELPLLGHFLRSLSHLMLELPGLREMLYQGYLEADRAKLAASLSELESKGVLPELDPARSDHVEAMWKSYLFKIFLDACGFYPPEDADVRQELMEPVESAGQLRKRSAHLNSLFPPLEYWKFLVKRTYPEVFLHPFLGSVKARGCDLACGWGRATLTLRDLDNLEVHCCDHFPANLERAERLVNNSGIQDRVQFHHCEIDALPFADDELDFTIAFDIFELLTDDLLERVLQELLRCNRVGAVLYCKITMFAYVPNLGQVQSFSPESCLERFTATRLGEKRLVLKHSNLFVPEHYTFQVADSEPTATNSKFPSGRRARWSRS